MSSNEYDIGYKKPPRQSQFKPGQSGNPKGRPKGVKNLTTDLQEELEQKITVTEANQTQIVTKQRAILKTLMAKALSGDLKASDVLIKLIIVLEQSNNQHNDEEDLSSDDQAILDTYREKLLNEIQLENTGDKS